LCSRVCFADERAKEANELCVQVDADERFYEELSLRQTQMLAAPPTHATPTVLLAADDAENRVRVAIRRRI
jgi:hypothetical protein